MLTITSPLTQQREMEVELPYNPALGNSPDPCPCRTRVLGRNMLPAIWQDMGKVVLPSWLPAGPKEVGLARSGKLSADQWRTTCTVHLVVTLGRTCNWGVLQCDSQFFAMYANFMDMVTATKLATMQSLTEECILLYEYAICSYLAGNKEPYKRPFAPNQHLALHLGFFLRQFGPIHAWQSFPFEKWNNVLQLINTNMHLGDLEIMVFQRFCQMQRLLTYWNGKGLPLELADSMLPVFKNTFQSERRGTLLNDIQAMQNPSLLFFEAIFSGCGTMAVDAQAHAALLRGILDINYSKVLLHNVFTVHGIKYRKHFYLDESQGIGDSLVILGHDIQVAWMPDHIEGVYEIPLKPPSKSITKVMVCLYNELDEDDAVKDPYHIYTIAGGRLYDSTFRTQL